MSYASLSVKPALLSLLETYIVGLDPQILRPAFKAIILALLPGLEDEASDEFERTHVLLDKLRSSVRHDAGHERSSQEPPDDRHFWQGLFLTVITSPSRRAGALQYLSRNFPFLGQITDRQLDPAVNGSKVSSEYLSQAIEVEAVLLPEPGLLIRCFAAGLKDEQILVQRGFLDLLVTKAPLSSKILQKKIKTEDLRLLVSAAVMVVLRREMSLNRRLWSWFLGPQSSKDTDEALDSPSERATSNVLSKSPISKEDDFASYFQRFGLSPLIGCLLDMISSSALDSSSCARPFRVCLSLMDRSEIGSVVLPQIFIKTMEKVRHYEEQSPSTDAFSEVLRSANVFFDGIQSNLIWTELCGVIHSAFFTDSSDHRSENMKITLNKLQLIWFVITRFNVKEEEMLVIHIPRAHLLLLLGLHSVSVSPESPCFEYWSAAVRLTLKIAARLMDLIPERALTAKTSKYDTFKPRSQGEAHFCADAIMHEYHNDSQASQSVGISKVNILELLLDCSTGMLVQTMQQTRQDLELDTVLALLVKVARKIPKDCSLDAEILISSLLQSTLLLASAGSGDNACSNDFSRLAGLTSVTDLISKVAPLRMWTMDYRVRSICTSLITNHWCFLEPSRPEHAVEAARCVWRLNEISPMPQLVESTICSLMIKDTRSSIKNEVTLNGAKSFTTLWTQTISKLRSSTDRRSNLGHSKARNTKSSTRDGDEMEILARPLLLMLDTLLKPSTLLCQYTVSWLQSLPSVQM